MLLFASCFLSALLPAQEDWFSSIVASGGPDYPGGRWGPHNAVDQNPESYWAGDPQSDEWELVLDLAEPRQVATMTVTHASAIHISAMCTVSVSLDGTTWEEAGKLPGELIAVLPLGRQTRFVKLEMKGKAHGKQPAIREIAFAAGENAQTPGKATGGNAPPNPIATSQTATSGWPAGVERIDYPSLADNSAQPSLFYNPKQNKPVPLLVALHTWNGDWQQAGGETFYARWCIDHGWAMLHPHFRGPNSTPQACGSEWAVQDILSAVDHACKLTEIDSQRIYLAGVSGGGHMALLMAGRAPEVWAGVSTWCAITDLADWHRQTKTSGLGYWQSLEKVCGGAPGRSLTVDREYGCRSPLMWLKNAGRPPLDINAGLADGHNGSVPVIHSLRAFNAVAADVDRIPESEIAELAAVPELPARLKQPIDDPLYVTNPALYRRTSKSARVTLFDGGHQIIHAAALGWLEKQRKGQAADFSIGTDIARFPIRAVESGN